MRIAFLIWMGLIVAMPLRAQVSGVVADTIIGRRVPGAALTLYDSSQRVIARGLADDSGRFRFENATGVRRLRIVKIGFRPVDLRVTNPASLRISMERLPSLLEAVRTSDQPRCSRDATRPAAFGLWEQARAALLGTVIARETNTARVLRIRYRRYMPKGDEIEFQSVRRDSGLALRAFEASYSAAEFMQRGFAEPRGDTQLMFHGPDAEVLLADELVDHYCLSLAPRRAERPTQVGLNFRPMTRLRGRVDVEGTLWIDTLTRVLNDIEYAYLGLESWATVLKPGGRIGFRETSPTSVWIDQWHIRMTGAGVDLPGPRQPAWTRRPNVVEGGAELASALWPDGRMWTASLGMAELSIVTIAGVPISGAHIQLDSTDYVGVTDSAGRVTIDNLLPGPYRVSIVDSALAVVDTALPGKTGFIAARSTDTKATIMVPTLQQFVARGCLNEDSYEQGSAMIVGRLVDEDGLPMIGGKWRLEKPAGEPDPKAPNGLYGDGQTGTNGVFFFCNRLTEGRRVVLRAWSPKHKADDSGTAVTLTLRERITTVKLVVAR